MEKADDIVIVLQSSVIQHHEIIEDKGDNLEIREFLREKLIVLINVCLISIFNVYINANEFCM
jgi:hypothetical protein